jgi:hypothetical protein
MTRSRDDKYIHEQPCGCTHCVMIRKNWHTGPGTYRAIASKYDKNGGTTTWTLDAVIWGEKLAPGSLIYVVRDLKEDEEGGQRNWLDGVLIIPLDGKPGRFDKAPHLCTSKAWIEPA